MDAAPACMQEWEVARVVLANAHCVWVGDGFASASRVAFKVGSLAIRLFHVHKHYLALETAPYQ